MKITHSYLAIVLILLLNACSSNSDDNGSSTTTVVPVAPNNLTGIVASPTQINLSWVDNSTNEVGFKIERKSSTGTYTFVGYTGTDITTFNNTGLTPNTTYTYRVNAFNTAGNSLTYTNEVTLTTNALTTLPTLTTTVVSLITWSTASSGGVISNAGSSTILARGVCWSTNPNPTIDLTTKTSEGTGIGAFPSNITNLTANTSYYLRAYATNSQGTAYGNEITFTTLATNIPGPNVTDIDGNVYQSVTNCELTFTKQNLNVSKYTDGTPIPQVTDPTQWANLTTGAWCYYNNDSNNGTIYGKLYNWYAIVGIYDSASLTNPVLRKKLAPTGWHIPNDTEWNSLIICLDPSSNGGTTPTYIAGDKMKEIGTAHWSGGNNGTNSSGFTALPAGYRHNVGGVNYLFNNIRDYGYWWSSSENNTLDAKFRAIYYYYGYVSNESCSKGFGLSVRCVKD